jgi:hypothetical protein
MTSLRDELSRIKERVNQNLVDATKLIQPERSWIRDQQDLDKLLRVIEKLLEHQAWLMDGIDHLHSDDEATAQIKYLYEHTEKLNLELEELMK